MAYKLKAIELCNENKRVNLKLFEQLNEEEVNSLIQWCEKNKKEISKRSFSLYTWPYPHPNELINTWYENIRWNNYIFDGKAEFYDLFQSYNFYEIKDEHKENSLCRFVMHIESEFEYRPHEIIRFIPSYDFRLNDLIQRYTTEQLYILYALDHNKFQIKKIKDGNKFLYLCYLPTGLQRFQSMNGYIPALDLRNSKLGIVMNLSANQEHYDQYKVKLIPKFEKIKIQPLETITNRDVNESFRHYHCRNLTAYGVKTGTPNQSFLYEQIVKIGFKNGSHQKTITLELESNKKLFLKNKNIVFTAKFKPNDWKFPILPISLHKSIVSAKLHNDDYVIDKCLVSSPYVPYPDSSPDLYGVYVFYTSKYIFENGFKLEIELDREYNFIEITAFAIHDNILDIYNGLGALRFKV